MDPNPWESPRWNEKNQNDNNASPVTSNTQLVLNSSSAPSAHHHNQAGRSSFDVSSRNSFSSQINSSFDMSFDATQFALNENYSLPPITRVPSPFDNVTINKAMFNQDQNTPFFLQEQEEHQHSETSPEYTPTLGNHPIDTSSRHHFNHASENYLSSSSSSSSDYHLQPEIQSPRKPMSKSQKIGSLQNVFSESQKVAYVGLCYLIAIKFKLNRLASLKKKKSLVSYEKWLDKSMEKLYVYLDFSHEERRMIRRLAEHDVQPMDMSLSLIDDAKKAADKYQKKRMNEPRTSFSSGYQTQHTYTSLSEHQDILSDKMTSRSIFQDDNTSTIINDQHEKEITMRDNSELTDVRYTIISHLFILSIVDGAYDARARSMMKAIADMLQVPWLDVIKLEKTIAEQLLVLQDSEQIKRDDQILDKRNVKDSKGRWALAAAATLAGGAVIGLTAGLAAPLIGAGIGAALSTIGITGAAGIGTFMGTTTGLALITTGGVLTGGGISGYKMVKRTRGIEEFEFVPLDLALIMIAENKVKRKKARRKRWRLEAREAREKERLEALGLSTTNNKNQKKQTISSSVDPGTPSSSKSSMQLHSYPNDTVSDTNGGHNSVIWEKILSRNASIQMKSHKRTDTGSTDMYSQSDFSLEEEEEDADEEDATEEDLKNKEVNLPKESLKIEKGQSSSEVNVDQHAEKEISSVLDENGKQEIVEVADEGSDIRFKDYEGPPKAKQSNVILTIAGWLAYGDDDFTLPYSTLLPDTHGDHYVLKWESEALKALGSSLVMLASEVTSFIVQQSLQATLLPLLMAGLSGPLWALKLTYLLDNPWGNGLTLAKRAGRVLADNLIAQVQDNRPVTLIGFSLGARVIFYCLEELGKRQAFGIVEDVCLLGTPVMASKSEWENVVSVVSGRLVNGYLENDWVLGFLYRASVASWNEVAGLNPVKDVPGVENISFDDVIDGHLEYRLGMPKILKKLGFQLTKDHFDDEDEEEQQDNKQKEAYLEKLGLNDPEFVPKELPCTLPTLVLKSEDNNDNREKGSSQDKNEQRNKKSLQKDIKYDDHYAGQLSANLNDDDEIKKLENHFGL